MKFQFVLGWVAGYVLPNDDVFYVDQTKWRIEDVPFTERASVISKPPATGCAIHDLLCWMELSRRQRRRVRYIETKVFKTPEQAERRARKGQQYSDENRLGARWFWRPYAYETDSAEHGKGLAHWCPQDYVWHFINQEAAA